MLNKKRFILPGTKTHRKDVSEIIPDIERNSKVPSMFSFSFDANKDSPFGRQSQELGDVPLDRRNFL